MLTIFGTVTSPFVRRVRIVCLELGVAHELVNTATEEGTKRLREVSPVWKVPVARFADGRVVLDSRVIIDELTRESWGPMRPPATDAVERVIEANRINMIDEALLSLIRRFYLEKDFSLEQERFVFERGYLQKDFARAEAILAALEAESDAAAPGFGFFELSLLSALDWMRFRKSYDLGKVPALAEVLMRFGERPSVAQTSPEA